MLKHNSLENTRIFQSDGGGEFIKTDFTNHLENYGILEENVQEHLKRMVWLKETIGILWKRVSLYYFMPT